MSTPGNKPCIECVYCDSSILNVFRGPGAFRGCTHPEVANRVTGKPTSSCTDLRRAEWRCGPTGEWFLKKKED